MLFTCILYCSDPEPCPPSPLPPRHCNVLANRWATQHAMIARILELKKPLVEYFRRHSSNERKLNSHEWKVTNEMCSLLDVVAEVTIRIQGGADTHLSQTMFNMREIHEIFGEDSHAIRKLDQAYNGVDVETEEMAEEDLTAEAQQVRRVLLSKLAKKYFSLKSLEQPGCPLSAFAHFWIRGAKIVLTTTPSTAANLSRPPPSLT